MIHLISSIPICLFAGFQFVPYVQRLHRYKVHRCCGRMLLVATFFQQLTASIMVFDNLLMNKPGTGGAVGDSSLLQRNDDFPDDDMMLWYRYSYLGFLVQNVISWNATIRGFAAARRKDIQAHIKWMLRLVAGWLIPVICGRLLGVINVSHNSWLNLCTPWINNLLYIIVELYIAKSGRFTPQMWIHPTVDFTMDQSRCPLLAQRVVNSIAKPVSVQPSTYCYPYLADCALNSVQIDIKETRL